MGVAVGDYDRNGTMDIFKTNFAGDTSTLYANTGKGFCEDRTFAGRHRAQHALARLGRRLRRFRQRRLARPVPRQRPRLSGGRAAEDGGRLQAAQGRLSQPAATAASRTSRERLGPPVTTPKAGRGAAFGDLDNDGDIDVVVNNVHDSAGSVPARRRRRDAHWLDAEAGRHDVESQRDRRARAAVVAGGVSRCRRSAAAAATTRRTISASHFGLGRPRAIDRVEVRWPNGREEQLDRPRSRSILTLKEGSGTAMPLGQAMSTRASTDRVVRAVARRRLAA